MHITNKKTTTTKNKNKTKKTKKQMCSAIKSKHSHTSSIQFTISSFQYKSQQSMYICNVNVYIASHWQSYK